MSKLGDAIRRSQRVEAAPMGFGAARPAQRPTMLVGLAGAAGSASAAKDAGADFVLVEGAAAAEAGALRSSAGDLPLGLATVVSDGAASKALRQGGADFFVFDADTTPAAALLDEDLGYVMKLKGDGDEAFLRSLEPMNLEAVLLEDVPSPLTVARQIDLGRIAMLARKPVLVQVKGEISKDDAQCLRAAGVVGLLGDAASVARLKEVVAGLPPRRQRREERTVVSLPRGTAPAEDADDDDE